MILVGTVTTKKITQEPIEKNEQKKSHKWIILSPEYLMMVEGNR